MFPAEQIAVRESLVNEGEEGDSEQAVQVSGKM